MRILKLFLILLFFNNLHSQSKVFSVEEAQKIGINIEKLDLEYKSAVHIDSTKAVFRTETQQEKLQESYFKLLQDGKQKPNVFKESILLQMVKSIISFIISN